jgi:hypothetical protein
VSCTVNKIGETTNEPSTATRQVDQSSTGFAWQIDIKMKVQVLADYITSYCMITAEGALNSHSLYVDNGNVKRGFTGCYVDKCKLSLDQTGSLIADITVLANGDEDKSLTVTEETEAPMTKAAVSAFTSGGSGVSKWVNFSFAVDNHVQKQSTGTSNMVSEIWPKEATYSGSFKAVCLGTPQYGFGVTTTTKTLVWALADNQSSPVTTTFTFTNAKCKSNKYGWTELDLVYEDLDWDCASLTIS